MFIYLFIFAITLFYIHGFLSRKTKYRGLKERKPLPFIGNALDLMFRPFSEYEAENYKLYGRVYVDYCLDNEGVITTSDPEHIKRILVKDFQLFSHRLQPTYLHPFARKALVFQNADWKRIRSQVTPVFTSFRLKTMFKNFEKPIQTTLNNIEELIDAKKGNEINIKKVSKSFALDIIGNVVFSLETNSFKNDDFSHKVTQLFSPKSNFLVLFLFIIPKFVLRFLKTSSLKLETVEYFSDFTLKLIEERKNNKDVVYNDFIEMLLKSEAEGNVSNNFDEKGYINRKLNLEEIVGQAFFFFLAGMETISTALSLLLYELSLNPDIQEKLHEELKSLYPEEKISYDDLNKSKYLDSVINETLRLHTILNRIFTKAQVDYDFGDFKVKKGQTVGISLYNLHHDKDLYQEPYKFRPERFENGEVPSNSFTFLPFLDGPRNCVGKQFARLEMRAILIPLLKNYRVFTTEKTQIPFRPKNNAILNLIEDITLGFEKRNK